MEYNGRRYTRYEISHIQCALERQVRKLKCLYLAEDAAGVDTGAASKATWAARKEAAGGFRDLYLENRPVTMESIGQCYGLDMRPLCGYVVGDSMCSVHLPHSVIKHRIEQARNTQEGLSIMQDFLQEAKEYGFLYHT